MNGRPISSPLVVPNVPFVFWWVSQKLSQSALGCQWGLSGEQGGEVLGGGVPEYCICRSARSGATIAPMPSKDYPPTQIQDYADTASLSIPISENDLREAARAEVITPQQASALWRLWAEGESPSRWPA